MLKASACKRLFTVRPCDQEERERWGGERWGTRFVGVITYFVAIKEEEGGGSIGLRKRQRHEGMRENLKEDEREIALQPAQNAAHPS